MPGQDPGQLEPDVPDPEDRPPPARTASGSSSTRHLAAAALDAVARPAPCRRACEVNSSARRPGRPAARAPARSRWPRGCRRRPSPTSRVGDDHLGARLARRVPAHRRRSSPAPRPRDASAAVHGGQPFHRMLLGVGHVRDTPLSCAEDRAASDSGRRVGASGSGDPAAARRRPRQVALVRGPRRGLGERPPDRLGGGRGAEVDAGAGRAERRGRLSQRLAHARTPASTAARRPPWSRSTAPSSWPAPAGSPGSRGASRRGSAACRCWPPG